MPNPETRVSQYYFFPDGEGLELMPEPLSPHLDGSPLGWKELLKERAQKIPPIPKDLFEPLLSENGLTILELRYLLRDGEGNLVETPKEMFWRVAYNIGMVDKLYNELEVEETIGEFYEVMANLDFLPNSPTLMNAGRRLQQLSACFVLPIEDSISSIMDTAKTTALIHQSGGGTGFSFSKLRPEGSLVRSSGGRASGPISFMGIFNKTTEVIKQGGKRRGANMGILEVSHPDIEKFIEAKTKRGTLENFNLSVAVSDEFMEAVLRNGEYEQVNPSTGERKSVKAKPIFDEIVQRAWESGDPGIVFLDEINRKNPTLHLGRIESTNPCGEQPLHPYESCNLGSINLSRMVEDGKINWQKLERVVKTAVHFLDNVIDMNRYPLPEIEKMTLGNRRIGLGVMGFADMLIKLDIPYDSEKGIKVAEEIMEKISEKARIASRDLAVKRGVFPNFQGSVYDNGDKNLRVRNATQTTIAPTGSISMIAGCSSGIEPSYATAYIKDVVGGVSYGVNPLFIQIAKERGFYSDELIQKVAEKGSTHGLPEVPEDVQRLFATAHEISLQQHVKMQAAFQKYTDNAVSKTINLPESATVEDVRQAYLLVYQLGCKGITVYRDQSREEQILYAGKEKEIGKQTFVLVERKVKLPPHIKKAQRSNTYRVDTAYGPAHVIITDELYLFKKEGVSELYWLPRQDFQARQPIGDPLSITFGVQGIDRTHVLKGENPEYEKLIRNWLSTETSRQFGFGEGKVTSLDNAVGQVFFYHLLETGIFEPDENGKWFCKIKKSELTKVSPEQYEELKRKGVLSRLADEEIINPIIQTEGQFEVCPICGSSKNIVKSHCNGISCLNCGYESCG